ncbi:MAG: hypothetical protein WCA35_24150, partial [Kovacikia sp.]
LAHRLEVARAANNTQLITLLERERQQIEVVGRKQEAPALAPIARLRTFWQQLVDAIANSTKLDVWQSVDSYGVAWWNVYDPHTGKSVCTDSESEMRQWIEDNYQED